LQGDAFSRIDNKPLDSVGLLVKIFLPYTPWSRF
jgi:hypothetical protein